MIYDKKNRRQFLLGAGGAFLALPFLPSLLPRGVWGQGGIPQGGLVLINFRNGWGERTVITPGTPVQLPPPTSQPSAMIREIDFSGLPNNYINEYLTASIVRNSRNRNLITVVDGIDDLVKTGHGPNQGGAINRASVDQVAAALPKTYNNLVPVRTSIELQNMGGIYGRTASWKMSGGNRIRLPGIFNVQALWDRIFGVSTQSRQNTLKSLNSIYNTNQGLLQRTLSREDRETFERYFGEVQAAALRVSQLVIPSCGSIPPRPNSTPDLVTLAELQTDIVATAIACGFTRIASIYLQSCMIPSANGPVLYDWGRWHNESHTTIGPERRPPDTYVQAIQWIMKHYFIPMGEKLDAYGLSSSTLTVASNDIRDGNLHDNEGLVRFIYGRGNGQFQGGRYLDYQNLNGPQLAARNRHHGLLTHQLYNSLLFSLGLTTADFVRPGEHGFGANLDAIHHLGRRQTYTQAYNEGAHLGLPLA